VVHAGATKHRMVKNDFTLRPPEPGVVVRVYGAEQADGRHIERQGKMERAAMYNLRLHLTDGVGGLLRWRCLF